MIASYGHRRDEATTKLSNSTTSSSTCPHSCANCLRSRPREAQRAPQPQVIFFVGCCGALHFNSRGRDDPCIR